MPSMLIGSTCRIRLSLSSSPVDLDAAIGLAFVASAYEATSKVPVANA
jgi:hypothetical protein